MPPKFYDGKPWLVRRKNGDTCVAHFINTPERGQYWFSLSSSSSNSVLQDVISFRKLPESYRFNFHMKNYGKIITLSYVEDWMDIDNSTLLGIIKNYKLEGFTNEVAESVAGKLNRKTSKKEVLDAVREYLVSDDSNFSTFRDLIKASLQGYKQVISVDEEDLSDNKELEVFCVKNYTGPKKVAYEDLYNMHKEGKHKLFNSRLNFYYSNYTKEMCIFTKPVLVRDFFNVKIGN